MEDIAKAKKVMETLWDQMRSAPLKMPPNTLILEGDHDLIYLYNTGFVDTDKYSLQTWLNAFRDSRKPKGDYHLTKEQWLAKAKYRYNGLVAPPFDPMQLREGEWTLENVKKLAKQWILPETTITYEQYMRGIEEAKKQGLFKDDKFTVTREWKQKLLEILNTHPSPRRQRALLVEKMRRQEELETPGGVPARTVSKTTPTETGPVTAYKDEPEERKEVSSKLTDLLSGSKK